MERGTVARYELLPDPYAPFDVTHSGLPTQGVLCDLIKRSFGGFVQAAMNSENFLNKSGASSGDAAKAQSWMSSLEFKRVALSNEIQLQGGRAKYVTLLKCHA